MIYDLLILLQILAQFFLDRVLLFVFGACPVVKCLLSRVKFINLMFCGAIKV